MSDELPNIIPPHSIAAEQAVLGAIIIDPECLRSLTLQPEDFYRAHHGWIYSAARDLLNQGKTPDYVTICSHLSAQQRLNEAGGSPYILELINSCPSSFNVESYAAVVKERAFRRAIIQASSQLATSAFDLDSNLQASISDHMDRVSRAMTTTTRARHISEFVDEVYAEIDLASQFPSDLYGVPTGFIDWDKRGGLPYQSVFKLSGQPGVGKSLLLMQVLMNAVQKEKPRAGRNYRCALFEIEMTGKAVTRRGVSAKSQVPTARMRTGRITEEEWPMISHAIEHMSSLDIYIADGSRMTTADIKIECQRLKQVYGLDLIGIDYEGKLCDPGENKLDREIKISQRITDIAKDLNIAVISIGSMLKSGMQGSASGMGAQAGAGETQHDRDEIATLIEDEKTQNLYHLEWDKNREGEKGEIMLVKLPGIPMFGDFQPSKSKSNGNGGKGYVYDK